MIRYLSLPALYAALCAIKDHHESRDNLLIGNLYANPEAHALWLAADELQHPERHAPTLAGILNYAPEADE